ncbi:DUF2332 domain-containing protein [Bacillus sp. FJAT-28004]|uniref:DUF2332 domain-containing protein n=1 Tax=Bacillus sp. FJAT-28004 TaxID=1679165 RepID=UPI0006B44B92|nr:DUF2332 domain-containing protein [Bacillus sp. FJAT-28004]
MNNLLSERFKVFATECKGSSRLYEQLSLAIAADDELLHIASYCGEGQPVPNLFFAAVHYLLLKGTDHELQEFYGSLVDHPREAEAAFPYFRLFCLQHNNEIIPIVQSKLVQTNEVRRCAYLYPAFCSMYEKIKKPLALIEIGTSAGLQLIWDKYGYQYNTSERYGNIDAELVLHSKVHGDIRPYLLKHSPPVIARIGIDLHVNNLEDPEDNLWLKSLIWPEHNERIVNFEKAGACLRGQSIELIQGNGVKRLAEIASKITEDGVIGVFHTHVANQMTHEDKVELTDRIKKIGQERDIFHLYNNMWDSNLHLDYYLDGKEYKETVAETDGHGRWFHWML